jgi:hypothetical protein
MKNFLYFISICFFIVFLSLIISNISLRKELKHYEIQKPEIQKSNQNKNLISPIVEIIPNYTNMPSYCKPSSYTIAKLNNKYFVRLPGGTMEDDAYDTPEEAQKDIIYRANVSKKTWIESGGTNF